MRTFPLRWVFPGGHVDKNESFEEAAVREVREEVGVEIEEAQLTPVALWESCYPTRVEEGDLRRQHLIIYFHAKLDPLKEKPKLTLQVSEVDMAGWISLEELTFEAQYYRQPGHELDPSRLFPALIVQSIPGRGGEEDEMSARPSTQLLKEVAHPLSALFPQTLTLSSDSAPQERISTGTRFVFQVLSLPRT